MRNSYFYNLFFNFESAISKKELSLGLITIFLLWILFLNIPFINISIPIIYYIVIIATVIILLYVPYIFATKYHKGLEYTSGRLRGSCTSLFFPSTMYLLTLCGSIIEKGSNKNYYGLELSEQIFLSISLAGIFFGIISIYNLLKQE